ncbi:MAG: glycosyltransferase [Xanthobacteraceae bacterium]|nr:glycosyltransferase [Xanthobacteraceae bacterium]QYK45573.1 MAG: glycosyltransferase [Xanthobacteraceae bacterium]HMN51648.1 glycosyltransferase family 2 protein [Xanthobacteraceae bacterium]
MLTRTTAKSKTATRTKLPAGLKIAVIVPCYNEEAAIGTVVKQFRAALPSADIYVYDNNSKDNTVAEAKKAGAIVGIETRQGKGHVVRRMFGDIDADVYVMIDGDATYDAPSAPKMIATLIEEKLDMVVGSRVDQEEAAYRPGHRFGNWVLTTFVTRVFGKSFSDILSGYRIFSRRFVKSFPALSTGFEIETELTVHSLQLGMPVAEIETPYYARPEGSTSKLNTYRDGIRILWTIGKLFRTERPMQFFSIISAFFFILSVLISIPVFRTFFETGLVPRLPTAILATALMLLSFLSLMSGLILDTVTRGRRELKRLTYLSYPAPGNER